MDSIALFFSGKNFEIEASDILQSTMGGDHRLLSTSEVRNVRNNLVLA